MSSFIDVYRMEPKKILTTAVLGVLITFILSTYVVSLFAFVSPDSELRWDGGIQYINGPTFSPGDTVVIEGYIEEGSTYFMKGFYYYFIGGENVRWVVNVMNTEFDPVHIETDTIVNAIGDNALPQITFDLPNDAPSGTYTVKIIIWSDWLPAGETRSNTIQEITFEVV
jgi:hypothetical protein